MVEKQSSCHIIVLRIDRGSECKQKFHDFLWEKKELYWNSLLLSPYTPQRSSGADRRNRTVLNMDRTMLKGIELPQHFWEKQYIFPSTHGTEVQLRDWSIWHLKKV